jgi:hypothetical protein
MEGISVRDIVFVAFPFSDLSNHKLRPALVLADAQRGDWILCQITSKSYSDSKAIKTWKTTSNPAALVWLAMFDQRKSLQPVTH